MKGVGTVPQENRRSGRPDLDRLMEEYGSSLLRMSALYLKDAERNRNGLRAGNRV